MNKIIKNIALGICFFSVGCSSFSEKKLSHKFVPTPMPEEKPVKGPKTGSIYDTASFGSLFINDNKAHKVGDIITVQLSEDLDATNSRTLNTSRDNAITTALPVNHLGPISLRKVDTKLNGSTFKNAQTASGSLVQGNTLTGNVSVTVVKRYFNGNLEILGQKKLSLDDGEQYVRVTGIIRPKDISSQNVVLSTNIANADITYIGAGEMTDSMKRGWLSRIVDALSPL